MLLRYSLVIALLCSALALSPALAQVPPLAAKPIDLLFLHGRMEIGFDQQAPLDAVLVGKLQAQGFCVTEASDFQPLTLPFLQQFHCVIYINPSAYTSSAYFNPVNWRGGVHMLTVRDNVEVLRRYAEAGGGLLIAPALEEGGMRRIESLKRLLAPYGMDIECAEVRDQAHSFVADKVLNVIPLNYAWSERITPHPATAGVQRIYYPTHVMRWDDNYTTLPLFPKDKAWTVLVQGMPGSVCAWIRGSIYDPHQEWTTAPGLGEPVIAAARDFGKGRVAVIGISHFHLFYFPYSNKKTFAEDYYGPTNGALLETGDGKTRSDLGLLMSNLYRWLAAPALHAGQGGYAEDTGIKLPPVNKDVIDNVSAVWADHDPMVTGPIRAMKVLVGAHSAYSDGKGSVADYAAAAKKAGYDVVCFTETFEKTDPTKWKQFVAECAQYSDDQVALLPGIDIEDLLGNRFLIVGLREPIRPHVLSPDGKKLFWSGHMLLAMGDVLPIAARPQRLAQVREHGALPPDLYSHCPGVAVATYRDGKQVDDGLPAYQWHLFNASMPIPVAIHEVYAPDELALAASTGLQSRVNSDTPAHTAFYFKQGAESFGGNPMRFYVSSGPLVDSCEIDNWQSPTWKLDLKAHDDKPITEVRVRDQRGEYRRMAPNAGAIDVQWHGNLGAQQWFFVELHDAAGGLAYLSPIRTLPGQAFVRCGDRQNWFGNIHYSLLSYTGRMKAVPAMATLDVPGANLPAPLSPKLQLTYCGSCYTITDYLVDSTLVPGAADPGADSSPVFNVLPCAPFSGNMRFIFHRFLDSGRWSPAYIQPVVTVTLKQDMTAKGDVWPVIGHTQPKAPYLYNDAKTGAPLAGTVPEKGYLDLPAGDVAGDIVALTPLRISGAGLIGFAGPGDGQVAKAGTTYNGSFVKVNAQAPDIGTKQAAIRKSMGFDGPTPYTLKLKQGQVTRIAMTIELQADHGGVAGHLTGAPLPNWSAAGPPEVPLRLTGVNPRCPIGLWRTSGDIIPFNVLEGAALGRMDVTKDADIYFGNLLLATNDHLNLSFAAPWTKDGTVIEVNNPTDKPITATITTPPAITDRKAIHVKVTVSGGGMVQVTVGK